MMKKITPAGENRLWILAFASVVIKCFYFQLSTQLNSLPVLSGTNLIMMISTVCMAAVFMALLFALFNKKRMPALLVFCVFISVLLAADTNFYRYYYGILTIPVILQVDLSLVGSVDESIISLFTPYDVIYLADLPLIFVMAFRQKEKGARLLDARMRLRVSAVALSLALAVFCGVYAGSGIDTITHSSNYITRKFGVLYSHLDTTRMFIEDIIGRDTSLSSEEYGIVREMYRQNGTKRSKDMRGSASGMNLIVIQMEAIQEFVMGRTVNGNEITPNLNRLAEKGMYFENLYYQTADGNTSDAEFLFNTSLYPLKEGSAFYKKADNTYYSLPKVLSAGGYDTAALHGFEPTFYNREEMYMSLGFKRFFSEDDFVMDEMAGWECGALSDRSFFRQSLEYMDSMKQPYYAFLVTLSSHHPFKWFEDYPFDVGEYQGTYLGNYFKAAHYLDMCVGMFMEGLEKRGLDERSLVVLYGDHSAVPKHLSDELMEYLGRQLSELEWLRLHKVPCIMLAPSIKGGVTVNTTGGQIDLLPTIANLMGIEYRYSLGKDLLNTSEGYAVFREGSVITDDFAYINDSGMVYDVETGKKLDLDTYRKKIGELLSGLNKSDIINENDAFAELNDACHFSGW